MNPYNKNEVNTKLTLCFWNINGVKNKFNSDDVIEIFRNKDIIAISETHFNIRSKCPKGFFMVGRSKIIKSLKPRGGVAIYKNQNSQIKIKSINIDFTDCVVIELVDTSIVIIALYIPPHNTLYYKDEYFSNIRIMLDTLGKTRKIYIVGDLNSRINNNFPKRGYEYTQNPDSTVNQNGRILINILKEYENLIVVNGFVSENNTYDSNYTFYRKNWMSQNDICITNDINNVSNFIIAPKPLQSDHCPCVLSISIKMNFPLHLLNDYSIGFRNYDHYDINKRTRKIVHSSNVNLQQLNEDLNIIGNEINEKFTNGNVTHEYINNMCDEITESIYSCCLKNIRRKDIQIEAPKQNNCTSKNFKAIAEAHHAQHIRLEYTSPEESNYYKNQWLYYQQIAMIKEEEEYSKYKSKKWYKIYKNDPKEVWKMLNWKGCENTEKNELSPTIIHNYFKNVFQSSKTIDNPKLSDIDNTLQVYNVYNAITDSTITMEDLNHALIRLGSGSGLDGISPTIIKILPNSLLKCILLLMNKVFDGNYPDNWNKQLLLPFEKKGHSTSEPKLRGIAIGPALSRLFDILIDNKFNTWYQPNMHQAGFRKAQGCTIQIFAFLLLLDMAQKRNKTLYICLLDYEKAFDFSNRAEMAKQLIKNNIGSKFLQNFKNMYTDTSYIPKISNKEIGEEIKTEYGVTQGKSSSANIFSFFVSDMHNKLQQNFLGDFMDPLNVLQLADDTNILADNFRSLQIKTKNVIEYSDTKYLQVNVDKTKYMEMSHNPTLANMEISHNKTIEAVKPSEGYNWLGFWIFYSNEVDDVVSTNFNKKAFNIAKFYNWLDMNESTPIMLKIRVLYNCMFASILYSCEAWGDLEVIIEKLLQIERKALKRCLGVKSGTTNDIIYSELNIPDIKASIIHRQYNFITKVKSFADGEAIVKEIWLLYANSDIACLPNSLVSYYSNLQPKSVEANMQERKSRLQNSNNTMCLQYRSLTNLVDPHVLYNSLEDDTQRIIITRWRLSSHKLYIETGRYKIPKIAPENRKCCICDIVEDEYHALYICTAHLFIRQKYEFLLRKYKNVSDILNPLIQDDISKIATYLKEIEKNMEVLNMIQ